MPAPLIFGGHTLDIGARQLFRGKAEIHLSPKAFDLLQCLIENRDRAVSKKEIHDRLWPGTFVSEANLASLVAELRRALNDQPSSPKFVRTVHGFGYAFCGTIDGEVASPQKRGNANGPMCWVVWRDREVPLNDGENIIGRDPGVAVQLDFPSVSRRHARIVVSTDGATLEDLGSKNGTLLKNKQIAGAAALADLDEIQVGSARIVMRIMRGGKRHRLGMDRDPCQNCECGIANWELN